MKKKLTIVIVNYNVSAYLCQCIQSVERAARDIDHETIVVDNASDDDSLEMLRRNFHDSVTVVESQHNLGFAKANNIAIRQTDSEYVLLLNPDTIVAEQTLAEAVTFMDAHPQAGGVGVQMYNPDGSLARESRRGLPTPWVSLLKMLGFSGKYYMSHLPWDKLGQIEVMSGAFCMLRREALEKVGLLDEDFFMYGEDIDLSYRLIKGGYQNWYVPAPIVHYKGESTKKSSYRYIHTFYNAMLIFFRKHYGHLSFFVTLPIKLAIFFRAMLALVRMEYDRMVSSLGLTGNAQAETNYYFVGAQQMVEQCMEIAKRHGLTATPVVTTTLPAEWNNGADAQNAGSVNPVTTCVVYDTSTFSFGQIIAAAAAAATQEPRPQMGTYDPNSHTIITFFDIIR